MTRLYLHLVLCAVISFRTVNNSYALKNFGVRFFSVEEMRELEQKAAEDYLFRVVSHAATGVRFSPCDYSWLACLCVNFAPIHLSGE